MNRTLIIAMVFLFAPFCLRAVTNGPVTWVLIGTLLPNLTFNSMTGEVTGELAVSGLYIVTEVPYTDDVAGTPRTLAFGNATATGYVGGTFTYLITAVSGATSFTAAGLPSGLSLDSTTGLLSGIPTSAGTFTVTLSAATSSGTPVSFNLIITIGSAPTGAPQITSPLNVYTLPGNPFLYQITATNNPTFTASVPQGLVLNGSVISTPSLVTLGAGVFQVQITATNAQGSDTQTLTINVSNTSPTSDVTVLHNFGDGSVANDGESAGNFLQGTGGSFYGITSVGGNSGQGTIFSQAGTNEAVVASLAGTYGINPVGLILGTDGNFYGVTASGGSLNGGTVFTVTAAGVMTVLHTFGDGSVVNDGANPAAGLVQGSDGNFYGTTQSGGSQNLGTLFQMTPRGSITILHSFGDGTVVNDGANPLCALVFVPNGSYYLASDGNYYADGTFFGTTRNGGSGNCGTIFSISTQGIVTILHSFSDGSTSGDGACPVASLLPVPVVGLSQEYLYGTTYGGGTAAGSLGNGTVFTIGTDGSSYSVLHTFGDGSVVNDGANPQASLTVYSASLLVGSTKYGGSANEGTVFQITLPSQSIAPPVGPQLVQALTGATSSSGTSSSGGKISPQISQDTLTILHSFGDGTVTNDGINPTSNLYVQGQDIYGTTEGGGTNSEGIFYLLEYPGGASTGILSGQVVYSLESGDLPAGLSISSATGDPFGDPYPDDPQGIYYYTVEGAVNGIIYSLVPETIVMGVYSAIENTSLPAGSVQGSYTAQLSATNTPTSFKATGLPPGLTCSSTGLISGIPTTKGVYTVGVSATNSLGQGAITNITLTVNPAPLTFTSWESQYPTLTGGATGTPENDGVPNLLKFFADINPTQPMSATDRGALPTSQLITTNGVQYLTLVYRANALAAQLTPTLETSNDLQTWTLVTSPDLSQQIGTDATTGDPIMQVGVKATGAVKGFIRLNLSTQ